jgi:arylsulfatase
VIFAQGDRAGGHALYIADGRLHYVANIGGQEQVLGSDEPIPMGRCVFGVEFTATGAAPQPLEVVGDVVLTIDDRLFATYSGMRMPVLDPLQALSAGRGVTYSVSADYVSPNPLRGAVLEYVAIEFSAAGEHHHDVVVELGYSHD